MIRRAVPSIATVLMLTSAGLGAAERPAISARGTVQVAFSPEDDAGSLVVGAIRQAHNQILVQAYSLTHRKIAEALVEARQRGVAVAVIADPHQAENLQTSLVDWLARQGVDVCLDGEHGAAHDKVMVLDPESPRATVITGSFNFTHAAQFRNSENLLLLAGNPQLAAAYANNWRHHHRHCLRLRP